jgi:PhoD-like phosphatase
MADLVLGPLLRYVSDTEATIWVETDERCEVEVLGHRAPTFQVGGHHYALVVLDGLEAGTTRPYEVSLDGRRAWPPPGDDYPPPVIRTLRAGAPVRLAFGSCRVSAPHEPPYTLTKDQDPRGRELDALYGLVARMRERPTEQWPDVLLLLGDQIYADEVSPGTREFIRSRRDTRTPPGEEVADFEEYTHLYLDAWSDPPLRWLLSTLSSSMIFDDHDVHDDWNTSWPWVQTMRAQPWWDERIVSALSSYWVYQHIGNLSPRHLADDELWRRAREGADLEADLRAFAFRADRTTDGSRWSYCRDLGSTRLLVVDSRAGRVLHDGTRSMVDAEEWRWLDDHLTGGWDHLLIASSLPILLAPGMQDLEAWSEAVCAGAWGRVGRHVGERLRQGLDLEHWGAFGESFRALMRAIEDVGAGRRGTPPASIVMLSGDVHHAYLAEVGFRRGAGVRSAVYQATCSPFRNPLDSHERRAIRFALSRPAAALGRALARGGGVPDHGVRWRLVDDAVWFDNQVATIEIDGRRSLMRLDKTAGRDAPPRLEAVLERRLA